METKHKRTLVTLITIILVEVAILVWSLVEGNNLLALFAGGCLLFILGSLTGIIVTVDYMRHKPKVFLGFFILADIAGMLAKEDKL